MPFFLPPKRKRKKSVPLTPRGEEDGRVPEGDLRGVPAVEEALEETAAAAAVAVRREEVAGREKTAAN